MHRRPTTLTAALLAGCTGPQSTLDAAGQGAAVVAELTLWLAGGALAIWLGVGAIAWYATRLAPGEHSERGARRFIVIGGVVFPVFVLTGLLTYSLSITPPLLARGDGLEIAVAAEQYWWRVTYRMTDGTAFETANEIRLPVGERVDVRLTTADVIHSFWIPSLAGKVDMIPGRENRIALEPTRLGEFRGVCAEFCGTSHGLMAFAVVVMPPGEFNQWAQRQQTGATAPRTPLARRGAGLFLDLGCGACHRVAGTPATGRIGPDLTHVGSRRTLAAGTLPMTAEAAMHWLENTKRIKPDVAMPAYDMLDEAELQALAGYLESLE